MFVIIWRPESEQDEGGDMCVICAEEHVGWGAIGWRQHEQPGPVCVNCLRILQPQLGELLLLANAAHKATDLGPALPELVQELLNSGYLDAIAATELPARLSEQLEVLLHHLLKIMSTDQTEKSGQRAVN